MLKTTVALNVVTVEWKRPNISKSGLYFFFFFSEMKVTLLLYLNNIFWFFFLVLQVCSCCRFGLDMPSKSGISHQHEMICVKPIGTSTKIKYNLF